MNRDFAADVTAWQSAYVLIGGMAATLTGLLFVAVSINLTTVMSRSNPGLRRSAISTFNQFVLIVELSIVFQIPDQTPVTLGAGILLLTLMAVAITYFGTRGVADDPTGSGSFMGALRRSGVSYGLFAGFAISGLLIMFGGSGGVDMLFVMVSLVIGTLISAVFSAWRLLVEVGEDDDAPVGGPASS